MRIMNKIYFYKKVRINGTLEEEFEYPTMDEAMKAGQAHWERLVESDKKANYIAVCFRDEYSDDYNSVKIFRSK